MITDRKVRARDAASRSDPNEWSSSISKPFLRFFSSYSEAYLRRHFHSVRLLAKSAPNICSGLPLVIYLNHSSWWDPLVCLLLARRFFATRNSFAPIDAAALQRYRFFRKLGFFAVRREDSRGAVAFLRNASAILRNRNSALWITPQGRFADVRTRPLYFARGLGHLARRVQSAAFVPLAVEYTFWEERLPEILLSFGEPIVFDHSQEMSVSDATRLFESALASVQDQLSAGAQRREPDEWRTLFSGDAGIDRIYDLWSRTRARLRGEVFRPAHSNL